MLPKLDRTAKLWSLSDGRLEQTLCHEEWVRHAAFSPDASQVITSVSDSTAILWDAATGACLMVFRGHADWIRNACFSSDGKFVATASKDACAKVWSLSTGDCLRTVTGHNQWVRCVAFAPSGPL
ncbi:putative WD repeat-containing protein [Symbiodinium microadriaticum]|uniref:Putative WD repeat-containing protein n=1 Tax=Symbiodinium microadriaticum TaxID=2951 RepID=A0A1Q9CG41_SYMMI|nr:putative WD repeat-containing protein [Symbiodinium microadriaticum]